MDLLSGTQINEIPPPTSQEVLDFTDKHFSDRSTFNRMAAIVILYQFKAAQEQRKADAKSELLWWEAVKILAPDSHQSLVDLIDKSVAHLKRILEE